MRFFWGKSIRSAQRKRCRARTQQRAKRSKRFSRRFGSKKKQIGVVVKTLQGNAYQIELANACVAAAKSAGCEVVLNAPQKDGDYAAQIDIVETIITEGIDLLILNAADGSALVPALEMANDAGIPCVTIDTDIASDYENLRISYFGTGNENGGYMEGKYMCEQLGGQGNVVYIEGVSGDANAISRKNGFMRACEEYEGIEVIFSQSGEWTHEGGVEVMENALSVTTDIQAVAAGCDDMAIGAATAAENLDVGHDILYIGFDGQEIAYEAIKEGTITATVAQYPARMAEWAVAIGLAHLNGELDTTTDLGFIDESLKGRTLAEGTWIDTGVAVVDQKNLSEFYTK